MRRKYWLGILLAASLAAVPVIKADSDRKATAQTLEFQRKLAEDQRILLALDRLTFGPRPGDVEEVRTLGLKRWMELQLNPERIKENPALAEKLAPLESLRMSPAEIVDNYPPPQQLLALANGRAPYPADPEKRAYLKLLAERYKARFDERKKKNGQDETADAKGSEESPEQLRESRLAELRSVLDDDQLQTLRRGTIEQKVALFRSLPMDKLATVVFALPRAGGGKNGDKNVNEARLAQLNDMPTDLRRKFLMASAPQAVLAHDLNENKIYRAVYSNRQTQEVLTDFWYNHFNVFFDKGADRYFTTAYEQYAIRPYVLGNFRDMLAATAESPAMMFYLDNWESVDPKASEAIMARRPLAKGPNKKARGLNENYARELLELHTLGVDGGYTQKDIIEVARCFTGWTIRQPQRGGEFFFNDRMHDQGEKTVLGVRIPAGGGQEDGFKVLDILVRHPSTAKFISRKLAQRFVSDDPPQTLVAAMAQTFQRTNGDIRAVLSTMVNSPEFFSAGAYRTKLKSPLEMVASAVRAVNADVQNAFILAQQVSNLGEPLYRKQEPTGYSNSSEEWVNSGTLLARMNFGQALVRNKIPGVKVDPEQFEKAETSAIARSLLFRAASPATLDAIGKLLSEQQTEGEAKPLVLAGLVLGSPEFQRR